MPEVKYVLTNEAMPGLVKIGITCDKIANRIASLSYATGSIAVRVLLCRRDQ